VLRAFLQPPRCEGTRLTAKRLLNLYRVRYEHARGHVRLRSYPIKLTVEATSVCNLRCPACFTGTGQAGRVRSSMSPELFRKLLDELGDYLFEVVFCDWGEPLLCKHLDSLIAEASRRGIHSSLATNFSVPFDAARAERLVRSGLTVMGVSIDGAHQETYAQYRIGGDLATVLRNCRLVQDAKRRLGADTPRLWWSFHVFPHNVADVERAGALAAELGMAMAVEKGWVVGQEWDPGSRWRFFGDPVPRRCPYLWTEGVVNNDGGVSPCCGTFYREDDMGRIGVRPEDLGAASFREVWNGPRFQTARRLYRERIGDDETRRLICFDCPQTIIWENWQRHRRGGRPPQSFRVGYSTNECFNYFWSRRSLAGATPVAGRVAQ
jgi:MoaA/NifB/PqqE/SkfB family radical SAM enzyme